MDMGSEAGRLEGGREAPRANCESVDHIATVPEPGPRISGSDSGERPGNRALQCPAGASSGLP